MRFHSLALTAFGPYADTAVVDFDELNDAGIFLLTGPTGAGKTSILDAICFALYGVVPGAREVRSLRSHHAAPGVRPEVELEVSLGHRRFRVVRSPEWRRPKKRGEGETRENASARLLEVTEDGDRLMSSRIQEVGHELSLLLGMSSEQFMQVVLLPQGGFQTFLCATSDERQAVLQRLFQTHRFARIEEWVRAHSNDLADRLAGAERQVCQLLATLEHRSGRPLQERLAEDRLGDVADAARVWAAEVAERAETTLAEARQAEQDAHSAAERADVAEREALRRASALRRRREAESRLAELDVGAAKADAERSALAAHGRALLVRPLLTPLPELDRAEARSADAVSGAFAALATVDAAGQAEAPDRAALDAGRRRIADKLAMLRALLPREQELADTEVRLASARADLDVLRGLVASTERRHRELPAERQHVLEALARARDAAEELEPLRAARTTALAQEEAVAALPAARERRAALAERASSARHRAADARERHLDLVERRLAGMAAELAGDLADGQPCPVCGGIEHPRKAEPSQDAVTRDQQEAAKAEAERLRHCCAAVESELVEAVRELDTLERTAEGLTAAEAARRSAEADRAVAAAEAAVAALPSLVEREAALQAERDEVSARLDGTRERAARVESDVRVLESGAVSIRHALAAAAGRHPNVRTAITDLEHVLTLLDDAVDAVERHSRCASVAADARARALAVAQQQGFGSAADAMAALLPEEAERSLRAAAAAREEARAQASAVLDDEEVRRVAELDEVDIADARAAVDEARAQWRRLSARAGSAEEARGAVIALVAQLEAALTAWEPLRVQHAVADGMNRLVRGLGADNQLQMRLSSYVLATRLDQVLVAANERLGQMRDHRYSLRREGRARGGARAGLGLELLDDWTGETRAPASLSGGETFVVSLALALGLADVVQQEAGGIRVDTLFVDEGFGMLDSDTLDDVMDRIDALRAGGRTVGVVSHVTELRGRIPTQLHVTRGRTGSSVAVRTLIA